jgi:hypothetical protein
MLPFLTIISFISCNLSSILYTSFYVTLPHSFFITTLSSIITETPSSNSLPTLASVLSSLVSHLAHLSITQFFALFHPISTYAFVTTIFTSSTFLSLLAFHQFHQSLFRDSYFSFLYPYFLSLFARYLPSLNEFLFLTSPS